ncbi:hypothetical protein Fot_47897 [Forsythia ovata]|uniref:Uncharacterized protein n=1 Tax=Forsythia ovata TaxID=205694 RepID=A0ABD1QTL7_9LAMI
MGTKRAEKEKTNEAGPEEGMSSKRSLRDEDDLEVLEEEDELTKKAKKSQTAFSKSPQNLAVGGDAVTIVLEEDKLPGPEGGYNHAVHIKKIFEMRSFEIGTKALNLMPSHLQRAITTVDSFWIEG